jgi:multidrug transporter EmrE-like cation transporter
MVYAIITGGHFFLYAWFYKTNLYAVFAGIASIGAMTLGLILSFEKMYFIPILMSVSLIILTILLFLDSKKKESLVLD